MWFWWFMLICDLLIPITMLIGGRMMWKHCPKRINGMAGYRTTRSMKNMDTWRFAHDYCGKLWWKIGWVIIIPSALIHIPLYHSNKNTIGFVGGILAAIQCIIMIASFYPTEKALKKHFRDDTPQINSSLSSGTQKPNTEKLTVDPRRVRTVSGLFYPQNQKSLSQGQKRKPFSPSSDIVH